MFEEKEYAEGNWNGKEISFNRTWSGHRFTDSEVERLLAGETITIDAVGKNGSYTCKGKLDKLKYNGITYYGFSKEHNKDDSREYAEGNWNGKEIHFNRVWAKHRFSDKEVEELLDGQTIVVDGISHAGNSFTARVKLENQEANGHPFVGAKIVHD